VKRQVERFADVTAEIAGEDDSRSSTAEGTRVRTLASLETSEVG